MSEPYHNAYPKPPKREKKQPKPLQARRKVTGEAEMFLQIWETRPHICTHCGDGLGEEPQTSFFAHLKPKGRHPELRLDPTNIRLLCFDCHYIEHNGTRAQWDERKKL